MSPQTTEDLLTYWVPRITQGVPDGGQLYPDVLISGRGKGDQQPATLDSRERIHPSVFQAAKDSNMNRMEEVLRSALFAIANGYNVSVTWGQKQ